MKRDIRLTALLLAIIVVSLIALVGWKVWASRERALHEAYVHSLNLTQALDTYAEGIVRQSSTLLLGFMERLEAEGTGPEQMKRLHALADQQQLLMSQLNGIVIYDAAGNWLMSSNGEVPANANSGDRAFFLFHRDNPTREVHIGPPIRSRATGAWVITVSRRFEDAPGHFAGVVAVTLGVENFLRLFGKIDVGTEGAIALTFTNGQMLVRYPFREQDMTHDFSGSPIYTQYLVGHSVGTAALTSSLDGVDRLYAFRKNEHLPLVTTVAVGKGETLQAWRTETQFTVGVATAMLGGIGIVGHLLIRDIRRRIRTERLLMATREDLLLSNARLEALASRDPLTGLANRRGFDMTLTTEARRAYRERTPLSLLLLDIDHFKRFNDAYGHIAGDECLKAVGEALQGCVRRPSDQAARYGGEEMAVILPGTDLAGAQAVGEAILQRLAELAIPHSASPLGRVSASIGVATLQGPALLGGELALVEAADQALYRAKDAGRNRVELAGPA
ncbi:sensor domain-containing diguanylate cyclase [Metapseudomonas otitidis]|uniref:GGDEF domain-containing protein n=1 Tax=Metapseudomonas otitidis TaxID=319939 RepID=UPI00227B7992|nr:sensor domain-containing diguanylate cyclase [Pseudomonas otitidis]WAF87748.1 sensor domain-containing diguanylate cyclase [Pseudomonas otitidis]